MGKKQFGRRVRNLIAAFRGLPPEESRSFSKKARPLGSVISLLFKKNNVAGVTPEKSIERNWAAIVGDDIAGRCHPAKILGGDVLLIRSADAVIRTELQLRKWQILKNLHRLPRCAHIVDVRTSV